MKCFLLVVFFVSVTTSCTQSKSKPITEFSQNDIKNGILVDVRTPEEFSAGHLENAVNINWLDPNFAEQFNSIDKEKTIYVYCMKGGRSAKAAHMLHSLGYKKVVDLLGGYDSAAKNETE